MKETPSIGLGTIDAVPLHELVYRRLNHALMAGRIRPGQKLTSRKLAQELGTSDMPVRAALQKLQALKALEPLPNGSLVLPAMTRDRFADLTASRLICEPAATEAAVARIGKADLRSLRKSCAALTDAARSQDVDEYLLRNHEYKFLIYRASGSESLLFLIETLWLQVGPFLRQLGTSFAAGFGEILKIDFHEEVAEALERGDGRAAAEAIRMDISKGAEQLLQSDVFAPPPAR
ncbi:GntR family transcriptional regulator [Oryzibacter oryziterrae]|uniref:GntR family transcriptional regulator n=1 Tax=Oryzibacter oryziterrae TaxID=2766474 RepID=UPI001F2D696D|nr:GntR family transcriptional regulator [Oryzibacter oryziterrae]